MLKRGQKGFSLIEVLIVLAVLAVLAGVVVPNMSGILGRGEQEAYNGDQRAIQTAVDDFYSDTRVQGKRQYPIIGYDGSDGDAGASGGTPVWDDADAGIDRDLAEDWTGTTDDYLIDFLLLVGDYLKQSPRSASLDNTAPAGETYSGHYSWYVDDDGIVKSLYYDNPVPSSRRRFQAGIYP